MATHFLPLSKNVSCTSTPQDKHLCQISWESVKNWGSSSRRKISPHLLPIICRYHGNALLPLLKTVSCTSIPQDKHLCQISWESVKNWGSSSRRKIAPDRPTARPTDQRHADSYIPPYTLRVCGGIKIGCWKCWRNQYRVEAPVSGPLRLHSE